MTEPAPADPAAGGLLGLLDRLPPRFGAGGLARLAALGIGFAELNACGTPRPARVRTHGDRFQFDPDGTGMLIQPVTDGPQASLATGVTDPLLLDLLAYRPQTPDRWYLLRGETGLLLGADALILAAAQDRPLRVHRTPLSWLQAAGDGVCLLDWTRCRRTLAGVPRLIGEDAAHDAWIRQQLRADHDGLPDVGPDPAARAAA
jgi:hypothetical protein